ncbi:MAG: MGMT family protein [Rhodobacteraceae bacterium]|nr:MGMT family protein [Paracoccaceae bacterium]
MTDTPQPPWQPLSRLPLFTTMIDEAVIEAQAMLGTVQTGVQTPHVLDDHTVDRILTLVTETLEFIALYQAQLKRWQGTATDPETQAEINRLLGILPELETTARAMIKTGSLESQCTRTFVANIPRGTVETFGAIAAKVYGNSRKAQGIASTIRKATQDDPDSFPWWRVVFRDGKPTRKPPGARERLEKEGVTFTDKGAVDLRHRGQLRKDRVSRKRKRPEVPPRNIDSLHLTLPIDDDGRIVLDVLLSVSAARRKILREKGMNVPAPRTVRGLVDTGASCTCVDSSVVRELEIPSSGEIPFLTPLTDNPVPGLQYDVGLQIYTTKPQHPFVRKNLPVIAFPFFPDEQIHVLIGLDLLAECNLQLKKMLCTLTFKATGTQRRAPQHGIRTLHSVSRIFCRRFGLWLPAALEDLNGCASSAHHDGWVPPTDLALDKSRTLLEFLAKRIGSEPDVYPMGEADIAIDFCTTDGRSNVLFVVDDDGSGAVFLSREGGEDFYRRVDDAADFQNDAVDLLSGAGIT